jgi:hypothetical protein
LFARAAQNNELSSASSRFYLFRLKNQTPPNKRGGYRLVFVFKSVKHAEKAKLVLQEQPIPQRRHYALNPLFFALPRPQTFLCRGRAGNFKNNDKKGCYFFIVILALPLLTIWFFFTKISSRVA